MDEKNTPTIQTSDPYFEEIKSKTTFSFDFVLWFYRILKYWYLFVLSVPIFLGIAYFENKTWVPYYSVKATIMLEAKGNSGIVNAVPLGNILRNDKNQAILIQSYEMANRTVNSLPQKMNVDYYRRDRFRTLNLYSSKPVKIDTMMYVKDQAYAFEYNIAPINGDSCRIYIVPDEKSGRAGFSIKVPYNRIIEDPDKFKIKLSKTAHYSDNFEPYSFRFLNKGDLVGRFYGRVGTSTTPNSSMMDVSMGGDVPQRDVDYLAVLLDEFQKYNLSLKNEQADKTISFIDLQLGIIKDSLNISRQSLDWFQKTTGIYEVTSPELRAQSLIADEEKRELAIIERTLLLLSQTVTEGILDDKELVLPTGFITEGNLENLKAHVDLYNELISSYKNLGVKNPVYEKKVNEVNEARSNILEYLQVQQTELQRKKDDLVKKYTLLDLKMDNLPPQERDFLAYQREYKTYEMYDQFLRQKRQEAELQKASNIADNSIWGEPRQMGGSMNDGVKHQNTVSHLLIGLLLPLIFIVLKEEILNFTISTKEECERLSGLTVIGTIENVARKLGRGSGVVLVRNYPKSSFAESFRNIRVRIEYLAQRENKITTLVTSSEPADGKTFIATNIASVYQLMGKKVVILDLDLRRPSVSKTLDIESQRGVSNYLIGQVSLEEITISHPEYGFDIIPAGTLPPNPSELIKTQKTKDLLVTLKEKYDYVVVDCSPVGLVSDAYILAKLVDVTLFVVRRAKTNKSFFKSVVSQVRMDGIENIALIFNDVKGREGYYGTSRYYGDKTYYLKRNSYYHDDYYEN